MILDHIRGREALLLLGFALMSELNIHSRPFKGTWCVQGKHPQAVHPFSLLLQS